MKTRKETRLTIVDHRTKGNGLLFEDYDCVIREDTQDDGKTLNIFITDGDPERPNRKKSDKEMDKFIRDVPAMVDKILER